LLPLALTVENSRLTFSAFFFSDTSLTPVAFWGGKVSDRCLLQYSAESSWSSGFLV